MCSRWTETNVQEPLCFVTPECRVTEEDGEIKKRTPVRPANQLGYCKNNLAGREVTAVRVDAIVCILSAPLHLDYGFVVWFVLSVLAIRHLTLRLGQEYTLTTSRAASLINEQMVMTFRKYNRLFSKQFSYILPHLLLNSQRCLSGTLYLCF